MTKFLTTEVFEFWKILLVFNWRYTIQYIHYFEVGHPLEKNINSDLETLILIEIRSKLKFDQTEIRIHKKMHPTKATSKTLGSKSMLGWKSPNFEAIGSTLRTKIYYMVVFQNCFDTMLNFYLFSNINIYFTVIFKD